MQKLKDFNTYEEAKDVGQFTISTTWVLWKKGPDRRARLVARGYEELCENKTDSPTVSKSGLRIFISIVASEQWKIKTTDIKFAFLQGKSLTQEVYIQPPREAQLGRDMIWKLNHCLYGLNDAPGSSMTVCVKY